MNPAGIARRVRAVAAIAAATAALQSGAAFAQEDEQQTGAEAGAAAEEEAAPAMPAGPCGAARCLGVSLDEGLAQDLSGEGAPLEALIAGTVLDYEGAEPVRSYFVAARYDDDRLVRYDVSEAFMLGTGETPPDFAQVIEHAFGPRTENGLAVLAIEPEISAPEIDVPADVFVGSMPPNTMVAILQPDRAEAPDVEERMAMDSVGVLAVVPADAALRAAPEGAMQGVALRLGYLD